MGFHLDNLDKPENTRKEPTLVEMTEKAIKILKRGENGFFLLVESMLTIYTLWISKRLPKYNNNIMLHVIYKNKCMCHSC